jgi:GTPase
VIWGWLEKPRLLVFNKADRLPELKKKTPLMVMKVRQLARRFGAISRFCRG